MSNIIYPWWDTQVAGDKRDGIGRDVFERCTDIGWICWSFLQLGVANSSVFMILVSVSIPSEDGNVYGPSKRDRDNESVQTLDIFLEDIPSHCLHNEK